MDNVAKAVKTLGGGGVIVYPTETVYGLGVDALNEKAIEKIFAIKERKRGMAVSVAVSSIEMAGRFADVGETAKKLFRGYTPGPLTLIVKNTSFPVSLTGGSGTIGIRIPDNETALSIMRDFDGPVTATSANKHGNFPAKMIEEAKAQLRGEVDFYVGGGLCDGAPSTVYDCINGITVRRGAIAIQ